MRLQFIAILYVGEKPSVPIIEGVKFMFLNAGRKGIQGCYDVFASHELSGMLVYGNVNKEIREYVATRVRFIMIDPKGKVE